MPDRRQRLRLFLETLQLRVMAITPGRAREHLLREQRLPPGGHQSLRIQVSRMYRPKSHGGSSENAAHSRNRRGTPADGPARQSSRVHQSGAASWRQRLSDKRHNYSRECRTIPGACSRSTSEACNCYQRRTEFSQPCWKKFAPTVIVASGWLNSEDLQDFLAMHQNPQVMATLGGVRTPDDIKAGPDRLIVPWDQDGFGWWLVRLLDTGQFIGHGGPRRVLVEGKGRN